MATKAKTKSEDTSDAIELAAFEFALKIVETSCGALPSFYLSTVDTKKGKSLQLSGSLNGNEAVYRLPGTVAGLEGTIEVPRDIFTQAVKGRKSGSLRLKNNTLVVKSGIYEAVVNVSDTETKVDITTPEHSEDFPVLRVDLNSDLQNYLNSKLSRIRVEKAHAALPDIRLDVRTGPKGTYLGAYDQLNFCYLIDSQFKTPEAINLNVPYARFAAFVKDLPVSGCELYLTPDAMVAITNQFRLRIALPAVDADSAINPDDVYSKAKELRKASGNTLTIKQADLLKFLENARALVAVGTEVQFKRTKRGTLLQVAASRGSVKVEVKSTGDVDDFGLVFAFVQTLVSKMEKPGKKVEDTDTEDEVSFEVVGNSFCICRASVVYVALLSAQSSEGTSDESE